MRLQCSTPVEKREGETESVRGGVEVADPIRLWTEYIIRHNVKRLDNLYSVWSGVGGSDANMRKSLVTFILRYGNYGIHTQSASFKSGVEWSWRMRSFGKNFLDKIRKKLLYFVGISFQLNRARQ